MTNWINRENGCYATNKDRTSASALLFANRASDLVPESKWTKQEREDFAFASLPAKCGCMVCGKDLGVSNPMERPNPYCGCMGGDPQ